MVSQRVLLKSSPSHTAKTFILAVVAFVFLCVGPGLTQISEMLSDQGGKDFALDALDSGDPAGFNAEAGLAGVSSNRTEQKLAKVRKHSDAYEDEMSGKCKCVVKKCGGIILTTKPFDLYHFMRKVRVEKPVWRNGRWISGWVTQTRPDKAAYKRYLRERKKEAQRSKRRAEMLKRVCEAWIAGNDQEAKSLDQNLQLLTAQHARESSIEEAILSELNSQPPGIIPLDEAERRVMAEKNQAIWSEELAEKEREEAHIAWCTARWSLGFRPCDCPDPPGYQQPENGTCQE